MAIDEIDGKVPSGNPKTPDTPKTRVQEMVEKTLNTDDAPTPAEELLDRQSGLYSALLQETDAAGIAEVLISVKSMLQDEGLDLKENLLQPALAATHFVSAKYMKENTPPVEQAGAALAKVSRVFGVKPESFTGTPVNTLAYIMERDFDIPALEAEIRCFGFDVKDGTIGVWNGPATPAPKATKQGGPKAGM